MKQNILSDEYLTDDDAEVDDASRGEPQIPRRVGRFRQIFKLRSFHHKELDVWFAEIDLNLLTPKNCKAIAVLVPLNFDRVMTISDITLNVPSENI